MKKLFLISLIVIACSLTALSQGSFSLSSKKLSPVNGKQSLEISGLFYETVTGRVWLPAEMTARAKSGKFVSTAKMQDGRTVTLTCVQTGSNFIISLSVDIPLDVKKWGLTIDAGPDEYYTGLMERVVDGPQQASWAPGIKEAMNLRGQKVDMVIKPTTSVYAPFYLSSRGYGVFVDGEWPGYFDFAASDPKKVKIEFEGPEFELKIYTGDPTSIVTEHSADVGHPILPPKWTFTPWRWRDEHTQRQAYYDGTPVTGPFNSEVMEDVLMMRAYGIPNGVYWIDRPWGTGKHGYDDFKIDEKVRLPNFNAMVKWLDSHDQKTVLWIAPFFQGEMAKIATQRGYTLADQVSPSSGNNFPMVDLSNPSAKQYWQEGLASLLKAGVAGFKLDRGEENIPDDGPSRIFGGRTIRENRNGYTPMYVKAVYDVARTLRGNDFVLLPRAAYTGTAQYSTNWGGDVAGTQEGLRASIIAMQRSAVMGYSTWGADTCGYNQQLMETEVCSRWLAFSAFNPIMEVGPTRNVGFWNIVRGVRGQETKPEYDPTLIAAWRMYARLHQRLLDYSYDAAKTANRSGMPMVRPLFMVDPNAKAAWDNWWTFQYGSDILVSPVWEKGVREQSVFLPSGKKWKDAWNGKVYDGGQMIKVATDQHHIPIFVRVGSKVDLGDLNKEWKESWDNAQKRPDLATLEKEAKDWFAKQK